MYTELYKIKWISSKSSQNKNGPNRPLQGSFSANVIQCWKPEDKCWAAPVVTLRPCSCSGTAGTGDSDGRGTVRAVPGRGSPLALLVGLKVPWGLDEPEALLGASQDGNGKLGQNSCGKDNQLLSFLLLKFPWLLPGRTVHLIWNAETTGILCLNIKWHF